MKNVINLKITLFSLCWLSFQVEGIAQESLNASGGDIISSSGSVSYSVGQLFYNTYTDDEARVGEGVQQAFEIYTLSVAEPTKDITMSVYPNPTTEKVSLRIGNLQEEKMSYQIYDINGREVGQGEIDAQETSINMSELTSATYIIRVLDQERDVNQTFKVIKK